MVPPDPTAVAMKRVDARDMTARCVCGSTNIRFDDILF